MDRIAWFVRDQQGIAARGMARLAGQTQRRTQFAYNGIDHTTTTATYFNIVSLNGGAGSINPNQGWEIEYDNLLRGHGIGSVTDASSLTPMQLWA